MCQKLLNAVCQYKSIRFIQVKNKKLACIYYSLLLLVLAYVIGFTIVAEKGYQIHDEVAGTTGIKLKGSASVGNDTDFTDIASLMPFDAMDLVRPSMEQNAFFLTTAITTTPNQTQGFCDGNPNETPECTADDATDCKEEFYSWNSQGIYTGQCGSNNHCQLYTWCPVEDDTKLDIINNVGAFTVFVVINVVFDRWNISLSNTEDLNGDRHPVFGYNLFKIDDILSEATDGTVKKASDIARDGAIILVSSRWYCDFDKTKHCKPKFAMQRIDGHANTITSGFNYRTVSYDVTKKKRLLEKLHGIRIIFIIEGVGSAFELVALSVTFGAGLAYMGLATVVSDIILERFLKRSKEYYQTKHREIPDDERNEVRDDEREESQALNSP